MTPAERIRTHRSNFRNLYGDIFWFGVLAGSTIAYLAVYAARLDAASFQISLITGGPGIVNLLISLPAVRWLEKRPLIRTAFRTSLWTRLGGFALVPLPWLFVQAQEIWAIIAIVLLTSIPGALLAIAFNAMFAEVVPTRWRAEVVGRRNALLAISMTATTLLCGALLDWVPFPLNYQLLFGVGAVGGIMTTYHLGRLRPVEATNYGDAASRPHPALAPGPDDARRDQRLIRTDLLRTSFGPLVLAYLLFYTAQHVPVPISPLFWVKELHLSDGQIGIGNSIYYGMMALTSIVLPRFARRAGNRNTLVIGALCYGSYPLIISLAREVTLFWAASAVGGVAWGVANAGLLNRLMERVPADDRPAHMAWHNIALNFGILCGSFLGAGLVDGAGLRPGLFIAAILRLLSGIAIAFWA
jgi:MFS family permease